MTVVITGAAGAVGSRVVRRLVRDRPELDVRAVDKLAVGSRPGLDVKQVDLAADDLTAVLSGADTVVHLASAVAPDVDDPAADELELAILSRVLDAAAEVGVSQVVVLSTAMVYGAWVGNPVPLTEDAAVHPNPDFPWATTRARVEQTAAEWGARVGAAVSVLRPTAVVTDDALGQLARVLHTARIGIAAIGDPPVQYLHADDLAAAIVAVVDARFDGVANVAPDGWIPPDALAGLEGPKPRVRVPAWAARAAAALRSRAGLAPIPPGVVPYTSHSWVVANDRMRALGWRAEYTNEEAWVVSHDPNPLEQLPARRRQELALVAAALLGVGLLVAGGLAIRRLGRRSAAAG
ncbi:MAG: NAD-dependent epimerase/dehydratase family protein [Actinomycetota bacterium]